MTKQQRRALRPFRNALKTAFNEAVAQAAQTRIWPYPYLAALVRTYLKLRAATVGEKPLSRALGKKKQTVLLQLLRNTTDRGPKVRSLWAKAARLAVVEKIAPNDVPKWLADGGGIAGRASEAARRAKRAAEKRNRLVPSNL
jgi:hypothetical protein